MTRKKKIRSVEVWNEGLAIVPYNNTTMNHQRYGLNSAPRTGETVVNSTVNTVMEWRGEFHNNDTNSHKFYELNLIGTSVTRAAGRIAGFGNNGWRKSYRNFDYDTFEDAKASFERIKNAKLTRGYITVRDEVVVNDNRY